MPALAAGVLTAGERCRAPPGRNAEPRHCKRAIGVGLARRGGPVMLPTFGRS
jgi:hypothetical protein